MLRRLVRRGFKVMNRDEYRENQRLAVLTKVIDRLEMPDLLAPDGGPLKREETVVLHSVPELPIPYTHRDFDAHFMTLQNDKPEILFLQFNPMTYLARQRYVTHQLAMREVDEFNKKAVYAVDNPMPLTWDECVVNLITLDMVRLNKTNDQLDLTKSLATYSYPTLQSHEDHLKLTEPFIQAITEHIAGKELSRYHYINNLLYAAIMSKSKVVLGDMPEQLLRLQLGNSLPLDTVKDIFSFVVEKLNFHYSQNPTLPLSMEDITLLYFPHIFSMPRDLYLTAMIKEVMPAASTTSVFVGAPHFVPIQRYWVGPPAGVNYTQATHVPPPIPHETVEMQVEKQALFDLLLDTKVWAQHYITNPFQYVTESLADLKTGDIKYLANHFKKMTMKYVKMRDEKLIMPPGLLRSGEEAKKIEAHKNS